MSGNLRAFLEQVEALGNRFSEAGQTFKDTSDGKVKPITELETDSRTFGDDAIGKKMYNEERYKPGTAEDLLLTFADSGTRVKEFGDYLIQTARELRAGEDANEVQHRTANTKET
ncbi:hypothetical protein NLX83_25325 [Allokutzneria sp. A3M-2-11 16]|uniref:hypothetical protein n=1 Tax=Allokutzneria sp. A3M-2-11 16 TaxID=2962043 RepID=UPI0020B6A0E2|nr:hypothetical protein [Allokutzneria sp. A3M-2-11 16]MCP3802598.1 hypothetical protein [Allokutzneria sp. A3M-2-11 16]